MYSTRRTLLKLLGGTAAIGSIGTTAARDRPANGRIEKLGHSLLSDPPGGYTEGDVRDDGQYALTGSFFGTGGSFLVDISNPTDPTEVHRVPSSETVRNADVKFGPRDGLYYRSQEPNTGDAEFDGVEIIDYGYADGTPEDPTIVGTLDSGSTHNVFPHPTEPYVYTTEHHGMGVFDVSDPTDTSFVGTFGPEADLHDVVVDPESDLAHLAFIGGGFDGYVVMDVSDPASPTTAGSFSYEGLPDYADVPLGEEAFQNCHYANYDPDRGIAVVGDEIGFGKPGGKHVFDIGWGDGSVSDPQPVGYTPSPNAQVMDEPTELYDWTTHNHDVISKGNGSLLVDGAYHEGLVVWDIGDPAKPVFVDRYETDDMADQAQSPDWIGDAPMAWGANYNAERDLTVVSDMATGVYVFKVTPAAEQGVN
ncbi:LVIVD repeat-containing protein [Haloarchaeobius sp. HRN-SO-5]|uniref:LVIVD repeat-containing protein n=1 Tax=Haloarchaeobius sp. HRN-SO-5 TaxID=3446118 RepID=UPI003EBBA992